MPTVGKSVWKELAFYYYKWRQLYAPAIPVALLVELLIIYLEIWVVRSLACRWNALLNYSFIKINRLSQNVFQAANNRDSFRMGALFCYLKIMANSLREMKKKDGAKPVLPAHCESLFLWLQLLLLAELSVFFSQSSLSCCWYIAWERRMKAVTTLVNVNHPVLPIKRHLLRSFMHKIPISVSIYEITELF